MKTIDFSSLYDFMESCPTSEQCLEYFRTIRWKDGLKCPHCMNAEKKIYTFKDGRYKCSACKKQFSLLKGTLFESTNIPLKKWFTAILLILDNKGCSSKFISKSIRVTQPNAWFLLQRIRRAMGNRKHFKFSGVVELDESFFGGLNKNRHYKDRKPHSQGRCTKYKKSVLGMLCRETGEVYLLALERLQKNSMQLLIRNKIEIGSTISTDEYRAYNGLNKYYTHGKCDHGAYQYVNDIYHTNSLEGFWGIMKRGIKSTYHWTSRRHLKYYCKEFEFRYNNRKRTIGEQFDILLGQFSGKRLMLKEL